MREKGKPQIRHPRTCPLCGNVFDRLYSHMKEDHERDADMLAFHLVRALRRLLNRPLHHGGK